MCFFEKYHESLFKCTKPYQYVGGEYLSHNKDDRPRKIGINDTSVDADGLKDLGTLVGLDRGDSHLGSDLHNTVQHRVVVVVHRRIVILV